ncbi:MAG: adenylate/guanylate cyclase domain-containing protein [Chloroflexota bacterium]
MNTRPLSPLTPIEPRLRPFLPADLSTAVYTSPTAATFTRVYEHLRTLRRILHDYVPRQVSQRPPEPGEVRYEWVEGTLMFTDLAGFTRLTEAHAIRGRAGAESLLRTLNAYFAGIIEIISKAGGDLLEFTGDALLVQFSPNPHMNDTLQAVRAGLRMQRAMQRFAKIETSQGVFSLQMRVGVHRGRFLIADIGTPLRMEHVLLGNAVQIAKRAEGAGAVNRVCLTELAVKPVRDCFRFEPGSAGHWLVIDDLTDDQLGEYDLVPPTRRQATNVLWDRSIPSLVNEITKEVEQTEPLASYLPASTLRLVVEHTAQRRIVPDFPAATVIFVNLVGMTEMVDRAENGEEAEIVASFSLIMALINAAVEARSGVLKKVTYHLTGSDLMILFGVPGARGDDCIRAADAALAVRDVIRGVRELKVGDQVMKLTCQIGMSRGSVFAAEVGEPHGRREFNTLGDPVNAAARLMNLAQPDQILLTGAVYSEVNAWFHCETLGAVSLKGKTVPIHLFGLVRKK